MRWPSLFECCAMMRPVSYPRTRTRTSRGFTLLEVAIVAAVASVIFLILIRWMTSLGEVAGGIADRAIPSRAASYAQTLLASDLASATVCNPGSGTAIRNLSDRNLELYISGIKSDGTPGIVLVAYNVANGEITRTLFDVSTSATNRCLPELGSTTTERVVSTGVYTPNPAVTGRTAAPVFSAIVDGAGVTGCATGVSLVPVGLGCKAESLRFKSTFVSASASTENSSDWTAGAAPVRVDRTFSLEVSSGGAR